MHIVLTIIYLACIIMKNLLLFKQIKENFMVFSSMVFLLGFLPCLIFFYFIVPQGKNGRFLPWKNLVLLIFSLIFYAWGGVAYLGILGVSIAVNYIGGLLVTYPKSGKLKKLFLFIVMALNLGMLGWYKYAGFAAQAAVSLGIPVTVPEIVLPIGISFFTFQGMSYVIDVYRGDAHIQKNPLNVALYVALFPQLVAGPIVRYTTVESEIGMRSHTVKEFSDGIIRFMIGFGKKMILANAMGEIADQIFGLNIEVLTTASAWIGAIAYTFQIYFDFSAYSDMAIGLGRMFGFHFEENFNYPYISSSVTEFWRRWHISLSRWFRDYVYIPLGGNRCSRLRHIFNLIVVWTLTGLWHGANWTFIVWGIYFGILLVAEKYLLSGILPKIPAVIRHAVTLLLVIVSWVLFRSDTISLAAQYVGVMFGAGGRLVSPDAFYYIRQYYPEFIISIAAVFPIRRIIENIIEKHSGKLSVFVFGQLAPKAFAVIVFVLGYFKLVSGSFNPFIYFQF